jgi:NADH-quinone oxidoreductase subunit J
MNANNEPNKSFLWKVLAGLVASGMLMSILLVYIKNMGDMPIVPTTNSAVGKALPADFGYIKPLGNLLFTEYVFPFEIASILFIAAMVGAVFLGSREKSTNN